MVKYIFQKNLAHRLDRIVQASEGSNRDKTVLIYFHLEQIIRVNNAHIAIYYEYPVIVDQYMTRNAMTFEEELQIRFEEI